MCQTQTGASDPHRSGCCSHPLRAGTDPLCAGRFRGADFRQSPLPRSRPCSHISRPGEARLRPLADRHSRPRRSRSTRRRQLSRNGLASASFTSIAIPYGSLPSAPPGILSGLRSDESSTRYVTPGRFSFNLCRCLAHTAFRRFSCSASVLNRGRAFLFAPPGTSCTPSIPSSS